MIIPKNEQQVVRLFGDRTVDNKILGRFTLVHGTKVSELLYLRRYNLNAKGFI